MIRAFRAVVFFVKFYTFTANFLHDLCQHLVRINIDYLLSFSIVRNISFYVAEIEVLSVTMHYENVEGMYVGKFFSTLRTSGNTFLFAFSIVFGVIFARKLFFLKSTNIFPMRFHKNCFHLRPKPKILQFERLSKFFELFILDFHLNFNNTTPYRTRCQ